MPVPPDSTTNFHFSIRKQNNTKHDFIDRVSTFLDSDFN